MIENTAPCGSAMTRLRSPNESTGGPSTEPPRLVARSPVASASATRRLTFQCGGTPSAVGAISATVSGGSGWPVSPA